MTSVPVLPAPTATTGAPSVSAARTALTLALFVGGLVTGAFTYRLLDNPEQTNPYPSLERSAAEPRVSAAVAEAIRGDDASALARAMDPETLQKLREAMQPTQTPIAEVRSIVFKGAVTNSTGRTLAAYVANVRDMNGTDIPVGFVLQIQDDKIVGVN